MQNKGADKLKIKYAISKTAQLLMKFRGHVRLA